MSEKKEKIGAEKGFTGLLSRYKWLPVVMVAGLIALVYLALSIFFMSHFFFRTTLNGMKVSACTADKVQNKAREAVKDYTLTLKDKDGKEYVIKGSDFGLTQKWNDGIGQLVKKQNGFVWISKVFSPDQLELDGVVEYDEVKLKQLLKNQPFIKDKEVKKPVNASLGAYNGKDGFEIIPSEEGSAIDPDQLLLTVEKTVLALDNTLDLEEKGCYEQPALKEDDESFLAAVDKVNDYADSSIEYELGGQNEVLDINTFKDWMKISEDLKVAFDKKKIRAYVEKLAKKYNTCYSPKKLKTTWGKTVTIEDSHYGWKVDEEAETEEIVKDLKKCEKVSRDMKYSMKANSHGENDYGDSYVEVNITAQHLYLYKDGKQVMDTDFVSGNTSKGNGTPPGAYSLTYKQADAVLRGANYASPVKYWMPFYGNYGMHDASWRGSFGGSIYKYSGSHGCVNLPTSAAREIFQVVDKGWPVLVYTMDGSTAPQNNDADNDNDNDNENENRDSENQKSKDQEAAKEVEAAIKAATAGKISEQNAEALEVARDAYNALPDSAKKLVGNTDKLSEAERQLKEVQDKAEKEKKEEEKKKEAAEKAKKEKEKAKKEKEEAKAKAKEEKKKAKAEEKAEKKEAAEKAKKEAEKKAKQEAEKKAKQEAEKKAAEEKAKKEAEEKAKREEEKKAAEEKEKQEAEKNKNPQTDNEEKTE